MHLFGGAQIQKWVWQAVIRLQVYTWGEPSSQTTAQCNINYQLARCRAGARNKATNCFE